MRTVKVLNADSENRKWLFEDSVGGNLKRAWGGGESNNVVGKIVKT
jgi:hypothetical protein